MSYKALKLLYNFYLVVTHCSTVLASDIDNKYSLSPNKEAGIIIKAIWSVVWHCRPFTYLLFGGGGRKGPGIISTDDLCKDARHHSGATNPFEDQVRSCHVTWRNCTTRVCKSYQTLSFPHQQIKMMVKGRQCQTTWSYPMWTLSNHSHFILNSSVTEPTSWWFTVQLH